MKDERTWVDEAAAKSNIRCALIIGLVCGLGIGFVLSYMIFVL